MGDTTLDQIVEDNRKLAESNRQLAERLSALEASQPKPAEEPASTGYLEYPRVVYRQNLDSKAHDVPGNDHMVVRNAAEYDAAIVDGWKPEPVSAKVKGKR